MRPDQIDLALKRRGPVLMRCQLVHGVLLELGDHLVRVGNQGINEVLAVGRLDVTTV